MQQPPAQKVIVFYDGVCALCNFWVSFLLKRTNNQALFFAPIGGTTFQREITDPKWLGVDSILLKQHNQIYAKSHAALTLLGYCGPVWKGLAKILRVFPTSFADWVYGGVANNRYRWFGKYDTCPLPPAAWRKRFLD